MNFTLRYREPESAYHIPRLPPAPKPWERHKYGSRKRRDRSAAHPQRKPRNLRGKRYYNPTKRFGW